MKPILTIDIGAGTTDILAFDPDRGEHYKAVAVSPIRKLSRALMTGRGDLLITGTVMGGGAVSKAVIERARMSTVFITEEAAQTINNDLDRVRCYGIRIVTEEAAAALRGRSDLNHIEFGDVSLVGFKLLLQELGVGWDFSYVAGAVQDHGVCPAGVTSLDFRHQVMRERLQANPWPEHFLFSYDEIPAYLTRMHGTAAVLAAVPADKLFMMDTGMAAIVGASLDPQVSSCKHYIVADIGNSHTLAAVITDGMVGGFFEYHTSAITPQRMEELMVKLGNGELDHREVVAEGGHGAYIRSVPGFNRIEKIVATGPRRQEIIGELSYRVEEGAPLGDNMMTGTAGLLECIMRKEDLRDSIAWHPVGKKMRHYHG